MKKLLILLVFLSVFACQKKNEHIKPAINEGIFIHLTKGPNNPDIVLTALDMALSNSEKTNIMIYLDADGVKSFFKDSPDMNFPFYHGSHKLIQELLAKNNVTILASAPSIRSAGKYSNELMKGVKPVDTQELAAYRHGKFLTIDY